MKDDDDGDGDDDDDEQAAHRAKPLSSPLLPHPLSPVQIEGVNKDGTRTFRSSFKVSAAIPAVDKIGGGKVAMVAMVAIVYRILREGGDQDVKHGAGGGKKNPGDTADLVVVLKRRGGHYHR